MQVSPGSGVVGQVLWDVELARRDDGSAELRRV